MGWKMTPDYTWEGDMQDLGDEWYHVSLSFDQNGFKVFGDTLSEKPKVLFIGDSYTASVEVSNVNTFYSIVRDSLEVEVFAIGHAGYGNLQEYMLYDQWVDRIRPS